MEGLAESCEDNGNEVDLYLQINRFVVAFIVLRADKGFGDYGDYRSTEFGDQKGTHLEGAQHRLSWKHILCPHVLKKGFDEQVQKAHNTDSAVSMH